MGKPVEFVTHAKCQSSRLQVFKQDDGTYNGWCFGCGTFVANPYHDKPAGYEPKVHVKTDEEIAAELADISECPIVELPERALKLAALTHFGIRAGFDQVNGDAIASYHFPYYEGDKLVAYKNCLKELNAKGKKTMWSTGSIKNADLFGWRQAIESGSRKLFITEGEFDAAALWSIIKRQQQGTQYANETPAVVSLKSGASSALDGITKNIDAIRQYFQEVVLVFDKDKQGDKAVDEVVKNYPEFKVASLPKKDANECLQKGFVKAAFNAVMFKAKSNKNTRLVWGRDLVALARTPPEMGRSTPFPTLTKKLRGWHDGKVYYIGAGVKMGKSELMNCIADWDMRVHGRLCFAAKPEEANIKTFQMLAGKAVGQIFHDPDRPFDFDAYDKAAEIIADKICMLDLYQHMSWETVQADIRLAAAAGCKTVFIDPITNFTVGISSGEANDLLIKIAADLAVIAKDLNITIFVFCHLKAPGEGKLPHERGGAVLSTQFAGSRGMMRSCHYMIGLEGNKDPDLPINARNKRVLSILEDREFGVSARIPIYWDAHTSLYQEVA